MKVIDKIYLENQEEGSDKFYRLTLTEAPSGYIVDAQWGRRGTNGQEGTKYAGPDLDAARKVYDKVVAEKRAKGYKAVVD